MSSTLVVSFPLPKYGERTPYTQVPSAKPGPVAYHTTAYETRILMRSS